MELRQVIEGAKAAAVAAVAADVAKYAHLPYGEPAYCGFAWVEIPDGRSPLVREMKKMGVGSKHWKKGWLVWSPGEHRGQSMDIHEAGARAYAAHLRQHGFEAVMGSRAD